MRFNIDPDGMLGIRLWCQGIACPARLCKAAGRERPGIPGGGEPGCLTWTVPQSAATGNHTVAGAKVFRLKQPLKNVPCQDCPQTFTVMRKIPARSGTMQFQDTMDKGFAYYYKIVLYDAANQDGERLQYRPC